MFRKISLSLAARLLAASAVVALSIGLLTPSRGSQGSCIMPTSGTVSGLTLVNDINGCNGALLSLYSGAAPPSGPTTGMLWYNTSLNYIQQYDGSSWNNLWFVDATNHLTTRVIGGGIVSASLSSASTTDLGSVPQSFKTITGTTGITSFGSSASVGSIHVVKFSGALTITYNATSMILPGIASITTVAGDTAFAMYLGSSNWQVLTYTRGDGSAVTNPALPLCTKIDYLGFSANLSASYLLGTGQAISRASYPGYFACATVVVAATTTASSLIVTGIPSTAEFTVGMPLEGANLQAGSTIASIDSSTQITMNSAHQATGSGATTIRFFAYGYGSGGDSTTVGVIDCAGISMAGRDPLAARIGGFSGLNVFKGEQNHTLTLAETPTGITSAGSTGTITSSGNNTINVVSAVTSYLFGGTTDNYSSIGGFGTWNSPGRNQVSSSGLNSITVSGTGSVSATSNNTGGGSHNVLDPKRSSNCAVRVLP